MDDRVVYLRMGDRVIENVRKGARTSDSVIYCLRLKLRESERERETERERERDSVIYMYKKPSSYL